MTGPDSKDAELERVKAWLGKTGYPLEQRVARLLASVGWTVQPAYLYHDPNTNKAREIDLLATASPGGTKTNSWSWIELVIECKHMSEKPWVVFSHTPNQATLYDSPSTVGADAIKAVGRLRKLELRSTVASQPDRLGHAVARAFTEQKEDPSSAYSAALSAATAALAVSTERHRHNDASNTAIVSIVLPFVVIDGSLFEYWLDHSGKEQIRRADAVKIRVPSGVPKSKERWASSAPSGIQVTIATEKYLAESVLELYEDALRAIDRLDPLLFELVHGKKP